MGLAQWIFGAPSVNVCRYGKEYLSFAVNSWLYLSGLPDPKIGDLTDPGPVSWGPLRFAAVKH